MLARQLPQGTPANAEGDRRFVLYGVPWWTYIALRDALDDGHRGVKMTYLEGDLELMSPSTLHEEAKKIIARLIEVWALERNIDLRGFGGATFRREVSQRGLEPDECYKVGPLEPDGVPDIAIEVIVTTGLVDKMSVYAGLAVPEVWTWQPEIVAVQVHHLEAGRYEPRQRSQILADLDLVELSRFVRPGESHTGLVMAYQAFLRRG